MSLMFQNATAFNSNLGTGTTPWNVSKVTTFASMFQGATNFRNGDDTAPINDWNIGGNITGTISMASMFQSASVFNRDISSWDVSKVTNTSSMFQGAGSFNQNIGNWNVIKVTNFQQMFQSSGFNNNGSPDINNWVINTTSAVSMASMFASASFNQPLNSWNTSEVINMSSMFTYSPFNNGLSSGTTGTLAWNTGKVTTMSSMFDHAIAFNQDISSWNVSGVITMYFMFYGATTFNQPLANWERIGSTLANVANMQTMFQAAIAFNQPIGNWNVSNVTTMQAMFNFAGAFNQPIGSWNVSKVTNMLSMFLGATAFNQNIGSWNVSNVTNFSNFMGSATFSATNLDAIYNGWIVNGVKPNTTSPLSTNISFGTAKYTQAGKTGKDTLLASPNNWRIVDGLLTVSGTSSNGGLIRVTTTSAHGFVTGNSVYIYGVGGTTNANGTWTVTNVNTTVIELQGSTYNAAWTSGGNIILP